jgi:chemotaxis protein MotA
MILIVGIVVVLGSVVAGYTLHGGQLLVLYQPSEFLIIGGAALGSLFVGTPPPVLRQLKTQLISCLKKGDAKDEYLELLTLLYSLFRLSQQSGLMALETHAEAPQTSPLLSAHPRFLARHGAPEFLCDSLRIMIMGGVNAHDFDGLMDQDLESHHAQSMKPVTTLQRVGDSLPGLGIVAAVLGVVITMGAIDGSPAEIGEKVAAALVGTFLGVFGAYGFVNPIAAMLEHKATDDAKYLECIKGGLLAVYKGQPPAIAVEFARRLLPEHVRPTFEETEQACRSSRQSPLAVAA